MDNTILQSIRMMIESFYRDTGSKPKKIVISYDELMSLLNCLYQQDKSDIAFAKNPSDPNFVVMIEGVDIGWSK